MPAPVLRDYQARAIRAIREHVLSGKRRVLAVAPTGSGKMVLVAGIIHAATSNFDKRILFVCDRIELINQAVKQLARWGVIQVGVIRADDPRTNPFMPVQVASIQTLARREIPPADFVFIDEADLAMADSYRAVLDNYPDATIVGVTATACRLDGRPLGRTLDGTGGVFDVLEVAGVYSQLIRDGYVAQPRVFRAEVVADLSKARTRAGDFVVEDAEQAMLEADVRGNLVKEWEARGRGLRTVAFAVTVAHSKSIVEDFQRAGYMAAHVDGETPLEERQGILDALESGELDVVSNCELLTRGWDMPSCKCLILARPTKSVAAFIQRAGRVLRPWVDPETGKSVTPIILDHAGNVDLHGLPHEDRGWSLEAPPKKTRAPSCCIKCRAYIKHYPCPECGFAPEVSPAPPKDLKKYEKNVAMREVTDPRKLFWDARVKEARSKGYKPGYAYAKYVDEFDDKPPWSWSQEAKEMYAADPKWQERLRSREEFRARRDAQDREAALAVEETDDSFKEWLEQDMAEPTAGTSDTTDDESIPF